ncbi:unnamed protein product [Rotaria sordida]|uniref:Uncharacterized protein n=2 Tax=Rotaria sordida TaxID=392033 RepID=A0A815MCL6_9BILA|nr:unnamed protein product [Rotaria sordida]
MTCSCGHYDYVDSTAKTLADDMAYHREHGNRIVHEKLTGSPLCQESSLDHNEKENEIANCMRLYQHSARCPIALRLFLDCNPISDDRSIILRYIIETLFIIHAETKLNMICPIGGDVEQRYGRPYDLVWCANLNHSSM